MSSGWFVPVAARYRGVRLIGTWDECGLFVGQYERVTVFALLEIVKDAFVLKQTGNEVEVGFAVLHHVFPLREGTLEFELVIRKATIFEHVLDDGGDGLVLKDAAI